jgi:hypothetical protein
MLLEPSTQLEEKADSKIYDKIKSLKPEIVKRTKVFINKCRKLGSTNAEKLADSEYMEGLVCWYSPGISGAEKHYQN